MKTKKQNTRSSILKFIVENTLKQELFTDKTKAKEVLEQELSILNFETTVSDIKTENNITFLQVFYKNGVDATTVSVLDISIVANPIMKIKNLESRRKWLCEVDGHSYVRTEIDWIDDRPITITWHLNEDSTADYEQLTDEQLEDMFWKSNGKKNNPVFYSSNTDQTFTPRAKGWYIQYKTESGDEGAIKVDREPTSMEDALQLLLEIDPDELWEVKFFALVD